MSARVSIVVRPDGAWRWWVMKGGEAVLQGAADTRPAALAHARFAAGATEAFSRIARRRA